MKKYLFFVVAAVLFVGCGEKPKDGELTEAQKQEKRDAFYSNPVKINHNDNVPMP